MRARAHGQLNVRTLYDEQDCVSTFCLRSDMRYLRRYIDPITVHARTRALNVRTLYAEQDCVSTFCLLRELSLTQTVSWLLLATQGVDNLSLLHEARRHTP
jgi:hypothetical protein